MKKEHKNSEHPGCAYCMSAGTPVNQGDICPVCGDRLPTQAELADMLEKLLKVQQER